MSLTKDHSIQIKGAAILCMMLFHLFGFPERIPTSAWWMGMPIIKALQICVPIYLFMAVYAVVSHLKILRALSVNRRCRYTVAHQYSDLPDFP